MRALVYGTLVGAPAAFAFWPRGLDVRDGRHDRRANGAWMQHGWLGDDTWFIVNHREARKAYFRDRSHVEELRANLDRHHITDVFPHLCPALPGGQIMPVDSAATEVFCDVLDGIRIMPWVGGVLDQSVFLDDGKWRETFAASAARLLEAHPRLSGLHLNVEPCPDGDERFLRLLDEIRGAIPRGKILSVAAYPPPTVMHPHSDVHWGEAFYRAIAKRCDQLVPMLYDTGLFARRPYRGLVRDWTREVLEWSNEASVLLGLPAYDDRGVGYHDPDVENLEESLLGVHAALEGLGELPRSYRGICIYGEWTMKDTDWQTLRSHFLA